MGRIFIAAKNRYLNISAVLKFATTQNEPKRAETQLTAATIHDRFCLTLSKIRQVLAIPL